MKSFSKLILETTEIKLTPKPKTLSELEKLYYNIFIDKNKKTNIDRAEFENFLSLYFMHILVENKVANWNVEKNPFSKNRYNLVVEFDKENNTLRILDLDNYDPEKETRIVSSEEYKESFDNLKPSL